MGIPPAVEDLVVADGALLEAEESAAAFVSRLRVAVDTGKLPPDVGKWALAVCEAHLPSIERQLARNQHLRSAANLVSGSTWAKARRLEQEILVARGRRPRRSRPPRGRAWTVSWHVKQALLVDPETPASVRHLLRLVTGSY